MVFGRTLGMTIEFEDAEGGPERGAGGRAVDGAFTGVRNSTGGMGSVGGVDGGRIFKGLDTFNGATVGTTNEVSGVNALFGYGIIFGGGGVVGATDDGMGAVESCHVDGMVKLCGGEGGGLRTEGAWIGARVGVRCLDSASDTALGVC
jgi:hypothetical protein